MKDFFQYDDSLTEAKFKLPKNKDVYYRDYVGDYTTFEMELGDDYTDVNMSMKDLKKITPATLKGMSKSELEKIAEVIEEDEDILATMIDLLPQLISNEWDVFDDDEYADEVKYLKKWQKTLNQHDKLNNQKYKVVDAAMKKAK
jgi:hypothetical protein